MYSGIGRPVAPFGRDCDRCDNGLFVGIIKLKFVRAHTLYVDFKAPLASIGSGSKCDQDNCNEDSE
jgi:hypothetical protein